MNQTVSAHDELREFSEPSMWRKVAVPNEHGGWGLTGEPVVLGLMIAPSIAGLSIGIAAFIAFFARRPLKIILVDRRRSRTLDRTSLATKVLMVELGAILCLATIAFTSAPWYFIWPVILASPAIALEFWFDARSKSRKLIPELAGSIGICSVVAMIILAGSQSVSSVSMAVSAWFILSARSTSAIAIVRHLILRLHDRDPNIVYVLIANVVAIGMCFIAVTLYSGAILGSVGVVVVIIIQSCFFFKQLTAKVIGITQLFLGLFVVVMAGIGFIQAL